MFCFVVGVFLFSVRRGLLDRAGARGPEAMNELPRPRTSSGNDRALVLTPSVRWPLQPAEQAPQSLQSANSQSRWSHRSVLQDPSSVMSPSQLPERCILNRCAGLRVVIRLPIFYGACMQEYATYSAIYQALRCENIFPAAPQGPGAVLRAGHPPLPRPPPAAPLAPRRTFPSS